MKKLLIVLFSFILFSSPVIAQVTKIANVESLRKRKGSSNAIAELQGYRTPNDGANGAFYWDSLSIEPDNGGTVFQVNGVTVGRWKRQFSGDVEAKWFGVSTSLTTSCHRQLQKAIDYCHNVLLGGDVILENGTYSIDSTVDMRNRTSLRGKGRSTTLSLLPNFKNNYAFVFKNGTSSMFNSKLQNLDIKGNGVSTISDIIYAPSWNEQCGLQNVVIRDVANKALFVDNFHGGTASFSLINVEIFVNSTSINAIDFDSPNINKPNILLSEVTITGKNNNQTGLSLIKSNNCNLIFNAVHFELAENGILMKGTTNATGNGLTGSSSSVQNLIVYDSLSTGSIFLNSVNKGTSGTLLLKDNKTGINITSAKNEILIYPEKFVEYYGKSVGIGTQSPLGLYGNTKTIHVLNNATQGSEIKLESSLTSAYLNASDNTYLSASGNLYFNSNSSYIFRTNGNSEKLRILNNGNVLVGSDVSTGEKLQVTGNAIIKTGNIEISDLTKGVILKSPNGTRWLIKVNDSGVLTTTAQ